MLDFFDPNTWQPSDHEHRIYGDSNAAIWAVVDDVDYQYLVRWHWNVLWSASGKPYLRRTHTIYKSGVCVKDLTVYLHVAVMQRVGTMPATRAHKLIDHRDGDSLNCRRSNLRWATYVMNGKNRNGSHGHDLIEDGGGE